MTAVVFQCPSCGSRRRAAPSLVGRPIRCPQCQHVSRVQPAGPKPAAKKNSDPAGSPAGPKKKDPAGSPAGPKKKDPAGSQAGPKKKDPAGSQTEPKKKDPAGSQAGPKKNSAPPDRPSPPPVSFGSGNRREQGEMDMTPMVDVTFLLLIFFMVTAAFSLQKSLEVPKPEQDEASTQVQTPQDIEDNPDFVIVRVDEYNTFRVLTVESDMEAPSQQELLVRLREARQGDSQGNIPTRLLVQAHGDALHEKVVVALDAGTAVGMEEVQLMTVEDD